MEKGNKDKKRKNSSDNYTEQPKTPKHGGSNNEAINTVSDILRNANETLYNTSLSNLDNSVFDRDSPAPHQSRCEITNSPTEVRRHLDIPEKYIHGTPHEDVSRPGVCQQTCTHASSNTTNSDILQYLKNIDTKISTMNDKLAKLDVMEKDISKLGAEMNKIWNYVYDNTNKVTSKLSETQSKVEYLEFAVGVSNDKLTQLQKEKETMHSDLLYLQSQSMRNNLIFSRLPETENENTEQSENIVRGFFVEKLKMSEDVVRDIKFERVHRIGTKQRGSTVTRNIVAKFSAFKDRETVKRQRANLRGTNFSVFEQYPREINEKRKKLFPKLREAKSNNQRAWISYDKLYIDGRPFNVSAIPTHGQFEQSRSFTHKVSAPSTNSAYESDTQGLSRDAVTDLSIISWNVNGGFEAKWNVCTLKRYLCTYDIIFLTECWIEKTFQLNVDGFDYLVIPRTKSKYKQGGGIVLLIRKSVSDKIKVVETNHDTIVWVKIDASITICSTDVYCAFIYMPPIGSKYYKYYNVDLYYDLECQLSKCCMWP